MLVSTMARSCCATGAPRLVLVFLSFCTCLKLLLASNIIPITPDTFHSFISSNNIRLLHVSHQGANKIKLFLSHYKKAAVELEPYGILLGQVSCNDYPKFEYCKRERTDRLLFGFRGTKERLVLPISTLADENAIVASALHLALINSVPIIQTTSELQTLEKKCHGKCNVVLAYHNTLGTYEHNLFLKVAWAYQKQHVFALTTSLHASPGAPSSFFSSSSTSNPTRTASTQKQLVALWVLQCKSIRSSQINCDASLFRNNFSYNDINQFIKALELPKWIEVKEKYPSTFERFGIHQVLLIYDDESKERVFSLAEPLGLAFRGSVGILICSLASVPITPVHKYSTLIAAPAIVFLPIADNHVSQDEAVVSILNGLENGFDFIIDQLKHEENNQMFKESYEIEEENNAPRTMQLDFQRDNETSRQLIETSARKHMGSNAKEKLPNRMCTSQSSFQIILYYLDWDAVSQLMLQIFTSLDVAYLGEGAYLTISCFTQAVDCVEVDSFPTIEIVGPNKSQRFGPMTYRRLMQEIFLFTSPEYQIVMNKRALQEELQDDKYIFLDKVALIAASDFNESRILINLMRQLNQKPPLLVGIQEAAHFIAEELKCTLPCLGILQLGHRIKHASVYKETLENLTILEGFLNNINFPSVPELTPEILPKIRNKVLIITLGAQPLYYPKDGEMSFCNGLCIFSWISRQSRWYTDLKRIHAPTEFPALIALNLRLGCSYRYIGLQYNTYEIAAWLERVISQNISPTVVFSPKDWKPLHPAVDYLKLLEDERHEMDQSIIMDNEDPFIFPDGIGLVEPNNIFQ